MRMFDKFVIGMASIRFFSGSIEIMAALMMLRLNQVDKALLVNSGLAFVGPLILIATTSVGLLGMADKLSWDRFLWVMLGVGFLFFGILKK